MKHKIESIEKLSLNGFVDKFNNIQPRWYNIKSRKPIYNVSDRKRRWLKLINYSKLTCPISNKQVAYCSYDKRTSRKGVITYHYNFYTKDGDELTIDHIIPISKGGDKMSIDNIQPMISKINNFKGNNLITNTELKQKYFNERLL